MPGSRLVNRNVVAERGRTSLRLEPELWEALAEISVREQEDIHRLVRRIEAIGHSGGRTSAVRVFVFQYFRRAATEMGHQEAGHGQSDRPTPGLNSGTDGQPHGTRTEVWGRKWP